MNRVEFGRLIASLRREHEDENDRPWNQERLAREANAVVGAEVLSKYIVSNIERGNRILDEETLLALAAALRLTSGERKEFFLAASGVDNERIALQRDEPEEVLSQLLERFSQVYLPAFIMDQYCDIVALNSPLIQIVDLAAAELNPNAGNKRPFPLNMLRILFSEERVDVFGELFGGSWSDYAYHNVMLFRTFSLRYRSNFYFQALLQELKKYRAFKRYWRGMYLEEKGHSPSGGYIHLNSPRWGNVGLFLASLTALTTAGELHFCVYVPTTYDTTCLLSQLLGQGDAASIFRVGSWPEKTLS